ncbi:MAG: 6-phosphogluconolactonase [Candidatus Melainabacteria bacterium]|nr:MAG: 6-phosphogluconolactonase [Candidatus Melainabacteria bacterium]
MQTSLMETKNISVFENYDALVAATADLFVKLAEDAIKERGKFVTSLSGGSTPKGFYSRLAEKEIASRVDWSKVVVFFGDERTVPYTSAESNQRMITEHLLSKVALNRENVFALSDPDMDPKQTAIDYERTMHEFFRLSGDELPQFDFMLLGLGDDGHTASLFPGSPALAETRRWFVDNQVEQLNSVRLTTTYPVINNSRNIIFLASGKGKAGVLKDVLTGPEGKYPSQNVKAENGKLYWYLDKDIASEL